MSTAKLDPPVAPAAPGARNKFSINIRQSGIYVAFAFIVVLFSVLTDGALLTPQNISNIIVQNSYVLILAIGMILVIIGGHIDLSVGSVVAVTGAVCAVLTVKMGLAWPLAVLITLLVGAMIGAAQGYWIAYFGIPAFIVTLAGMLVFRALSMTVLGNQGIGPFPDQIRTLANGFTEGYLGNVALGPLGGADLVSLLVGLACVAAYAFSQLRKRQARLGYKQTVEPMGVFVAKIVGMAVIVLAVVVQLARFRNLPWVLVLLAALALGYSLLANRSVFGRHIYAIGGNLQAAQLSGVKTKQVTFWLFVNMGVLAALAGVIFAGRLNQAGPTAGNSFELDAIAAAFIGGAAVQGGVGKVVGAITGGMIMGVINNGMSLIGSPSEQVMLVKGLVLLAAVAYDVWTKRRS
ncbi:sugar ABC transporter permease [Actinosynnema pretiosum subsp. pretiosum]|uniref:Xylose transport system permease protein XylH n=2 Tax=Actinosynnema TaxID=40566 RepID=C6WE71_ACTMD|nr:multiple monosaccharide ABC transporter permease [Actinosynnema mirum]ACU35814.1 inner-membrane translocator [Actinosynnema mirum DSM 43827]AXX29238.1 L-arabinose transport system permease protein [Actinosynnema pretiosum subsp. pretiosum]QUF06497.1 sugar ABC transporter permease [Actinosynnema pretiosum subsp. pretiosum]